MKIYLAKEGYLLIKDRAIIMDKDNTISVSIEGTVSKILIRLNYKKRTMIKGKRRHSWYIEISTFNISYEDMASETFRTLEQLRNLKDYVLLYYNNEVYKCLIEGESFEYSSEYSQVLLDDLYKGSISLEETIEKEDN